MAKKYEIKYKYSEALQERLYVESAKRADRSTITVDDSQLSSAGRAAALTALCAHTGWSKTHLLTAPPSEIVHAQTAHEIHTDSIDIDWSDPADHEPTAEQAVRDVETVLRVAADAAPSVRERLDELCAERDAAQAQRLEERTLAVLREGPRGRLYRPRGGEWAAHDRWYAINRLKVDADDPRVRKLLEAAAAEARHRNEAEVAEAEAAERDHKAAVERWLAEHGTASQRARHAEGLLSDIELRDAIRAHLFAPLADFERYQRLACSDVPHDDDCLLTGDCAFGAHDAKGLSDEAYARLTEIRAAMAEIEGVTVQPRMHEAECDTCDQSTERDSALVTIRWGGRKYSREYAL